MTMRKLQSLPNHRKHSGLPFLNKDGLIPFDKMQYNLLENLANPRFATTVSTSAKTQNLHFVVNSLVLLIARF